MEYESPDPPTGCSRSASTSSVRLSVNSRWRFRDVWGMNRS